MKCVEVAARSSTGARMEGGSRGARAEGGKGSHRGTSSKGKQGQLTQGTGMRTRAASERMKFCQVRT
eukprot:346978-Rhodomonas_salina.2